MFSLLKIIPEAIGAYLYDKGVAREINGKYPTAWLHFYISSWLGIPNAFDALGNMHRDGLGVSQDISYSFIFYEKAASMGFAQSQYSLGCLYESANKEMDKALFWYETAAQNGYPKAAFNAAIMHKEFGNYEKCEQYAKLAVSLGDLDAVDLLRSQDPSFEKKLKINKTPQVFIGYSATRSKFWKNFIRTSLIPFFKEKGIPFYDYISHHSILEGISKETATKEIMLQMQYSDLYLCLLDKNTWSDYINICAGAETKSIAERIKYTDDIFKIEREYSFNFLRSPLSQLTLVENSSDFSMTESIKTIKLHETVIDLKQSPEPEEILSIIFNHLSYYFHW